MKSKLIKTIAFSLGASLLSGCGLVNNYIDGRINERLDFEHMPRIVYAIPDWYTNEYFNSREQIQKGRQKNEQDNLIEIFQRTLPHHNESTTITLELY